LPSGTPVAAGAGDQAAAALGAAVVDPGQAFDSAGTASVFALCTDTFAPDAEGRTFMATHAVLPGRYLAVAFLNGGGLALRWFRDEVARLDASDPEAYARLDALAAVVEPGCGGLLWHPHFQGRVLPPLPNARGGWVGATSGHTLGHLFRAQLEGIAFQYAEWAERITELGGTRPTEARALGGGARSSLWNQIKADVLGIDWVPAARAECGVLGDALIAAAATGHVADLAAAARRWQTTEAPFRPDPEQQRRYAAMRPAFRALGTQLPPVFDRLTEGAA
jgi:xylulokinase